jgi:hypothetical protein
VSELGLKPRQADLRKGTHALAKGHRSDGADSHWISRLFMELRRRLGLPAESLKSMTLSAG